MISGRLFCGVKKPSGDGNNKVDRREAFFKNKKGCGKFGTFKIQRDLYSAFLIMNVKDNLKKIDRKRCFDTFDRFKKLHDLEIERLKLDEKVLASMGM